MTSLNLPFNAREVVDKGANAVLDEIEGTVLEVASTILEGNGFAFDVPSRAKGNQVGFYAHWQFSSQGFCFVRNDNAFSSLVLLFFTSIGIDAGSECTDASLLSSLMQMYVAELDRIVLKDTTSKRPFASTQTCRKTAVTTRILGLVHQLCTKQIHVTKRDLFYTDVKLFEDQSQSDSVLDDMACMLGCTRSSLHGDCEISDRTFA